MMNPEIAAIVKARTAAYGAMIRAAASCKTEDFQQKKAEYLRTVAAENAYWNGYAWQPHDNTGDDGK